MSESSHRPEDHRVVKGASDASIRDAGSQTAGENPTPGDRNQNPPGIGLLELIPEDFRTHDRNLFEPGFWAVAIHRLGNARMDIRPRFLRMPASVAYRVAHGCMSGLFGINLEYSVKLGRRVRLWHHGGMFLGAVSIGDDVTIRHNTTMGVLHQEEKWKKPIIGDRVDIGTGACIFGDVTVGHDTVIGANSVVVRSFPPYSTVFGVPARRVNVKEGPTGGPQRGTPRRQGPVLRSLSSRAAGI